MTPTRRGVVGGLCACALCGGAAAARIRPADMVPLVQPDHRPVDADERGIWDRMERIEEEVAGSNLLVTDPALNRYVGTVLERVAGPHIDDVRLHIVQSRGLNAAMFPNGLMYLHSGALLRFENEGQLAAVLAHETAHYLRRHSLRSYRTIRSRTDVLSFAGLGIGLGGVAAGTSTGNVVQSIYAAVFLGLLAYSRELEAEADAMSVALLARAGYAPGEASRIWVNVVGERDASARARRKRPDRGYSLLSTHPASEARLADLAASARELGAGGRTEPDVYAKAIAPLRGALLDEQVKLNDPGASLYVIDRQATRGWDGMLRYQQAEVYRLRGEAGDAERAAAATAEAVTMPAAPAEAFRAHGYALLKAGRGEEGRAMLRRYLALSPQAKDRAMIDFTLKQ